MPLRVVSCCSYLTAAEGIIWRPCDYDAHDFVMAVKGRSIEGFAKIPCRGQVHHVDDSCQDLALKLFGLMIADVAPVEDGLARPVLLVPVPNSRCSRHSTTPPRTTAQAEALARELGEGAAVWDGLRWAEPLKSAWSSAGTRDPQVLFDKLTAAAAWPQRGTSVVLVDDVLASGGHLQACAAALRRAGCHPRIGVVAGRSDRTQADDPFSVRVDVLADFAPPLKTSSPAETDIPRSAPRLHQDR